MYRSRGVIKSTVERRNTPFVCVAQNLSGLAGCTLLLMQGNFLVLPAFGIVASLLPVWTLCH